MITTVFIVASVVAVAYLFVVGFTWNMQVPGPIRGHKDETFESSAWMWPLAVLMLVCIAPFWAGEALHARKTRKSRVVSE